MALVDYNMESVLAFCASQIECDDSQRLLHDSARVEFTSGGIEDDVWCDSQIKAASLFCQEFAAYVKDRKGRLRWGTKPEMTVKKFFSHRTTNFMQTHIMYCVYSTFEINEHAEARPEDHAQ